MARTKQTARKDQGGKAPRRIFNTKNPGSIKAQRATKKEKPVIPNQRSEDLGPEH